MLSWLYSSASTLLRLSFPDWALLALLLIGWYHFGSPCSPSQSPILFSLKYFGYNYVWKCVYMSHYFCNVDFVFIIHRGSSFISWHVLLFVLVFALTTFNPITSDVWRPNPQTKDHTWTSELGALSPRSQIARELLSPEGINYWELWHLYTKPSII